MAAAAVYQCDTESAVALSGTTIKTVAGVKAHANSGLTLIGFVVAFDGVTSNAVPALVEVNYITWATNSPGTNSTSTTPRQTSGRVLTAGFTAAKNWTSEPTAHTPAFPPFYLPQFMGSMVYNFPLGLEPDSALAEGFCIRVTPTANVNCRAGLIVART